jgi:hypothetical protein
MALLWKSRVAIPAEFAVGRQMGGTFDGANCPYAPLGSTLDIVGPKADEQSDDGGPKSSAISALLLPVQGRRRPKRVRD